LSARQRIVRVRRQYNQWVANQTLEDFALRFTAKRARRWSMVWVANTALGAISFLALEAIGSAITLRYGFANAVPAILAVSVLIFLAGLPIAYYSARHGVDIDLLTRGAGFGYIGSTVTSLVYASFTFIFFAIEAAIMSMALDLCLGIPRPVGYLLSSLVIIPMVTYGIRFIGWLQAWTQPVWLTLQALPFLAVLLSHHDLLNGWANFDGAEHSRTFTVVLFGGAASTVLSLIAQIGEQVDFLRFLPAKTEENRVGWWTALLLAGPGWIIVGALKLLAGSFLAYAAIHMGYQAMAASEPTQLYRVGFSLLLPNSPKIVVAMVGLFVVTSQIKINVTNAYAGSIAWSNFFSRLTHSHPGRVVWVVFNVGLALLLMELGIFGAIERILSLYSNVAIAWMGTIVADLVINKPLGLSPPLIEFKRAHLYDINPVGMGSMLLATMVSLVAFSGALGETARALAPFFALGTALVATPAIAVATKSRFYIARRPPNRWSTRSEVQCCICEHSFEPEDMAYCPAYAGAICSLCCSLDARCHDRCKSGPHIFQHAAALLARLPFKIGTAAGIRIGYFAGVMLLFAAVLGLTLMIVFFQKTGTPGADAGLIAGILWSVFFSLLIVMGVVAWLFVLAHESRRMMEEESTRQNTMLQREISAHQRTDTMLQKAKEVAEAANLAKSRYLVGISHELRSPLNAIFGYAQILEKDPALPSHRVGAIRVIRRSAEHFSNLIDGLLDISKIEAGRLNLKRQEVRTGAFLEQIVDMFRIQATEKGLNFVYAPIDPLPAVVATDEKCLRQILINLLSNAVKYTQTGTVTLRHRYRSQVAEFDVEDTGVGIGADDIERIFEPFERSASAAVQSVPGTGLGLTITKLLTAVMGGEITVVSEPGKGSEFRLKMLLLEVANPKPQETVPDRVTGYRGVRRKVLVADDDVGHVNLLRDVLCPLGFVVFAAHDGASCLALAEQCQPDVALLDISMPGGMDGWEVARRLRAAGHRQTRIIMVSANVEERRIDTAGDPDNPGPHNDFLPKPLNIQLLLERLGHWLGVDWISGPSAALEEASVPVTAIRPAIADLPAAHHVEALIHLGSIGYVRGIEAKLKEIEDDSPQNGPFVDRLRALVEGCHLKQFMEILEAARSDAN